MKFKIGIFACAVTLIASSAVAENLLIPGLSMVEYDQQDVTLGKVFTMTLPVPSASTRTACGRVTLELYMDVSAKDRDGYINEAPIVEVYALSEGNTSFTRQALDETLVARRPIAAGEGRRVLIDITSIAKPLIDGDRASVTLAIGSLSGLEEGDFHLRTDMLPDGAVARVYFDELSSAEQPGVQE